MQLRALLVPSLRSAALLVTLPAFFPPSILACAACFGQTDDRMAQGMNAGILTLLAVIGTVLVGVAAFFVHVARQSKRQP